jgi:hypothetical protein
MRVLVACEYSGRVRDAFIAKGHDAISCDLLPTDQPGPHYQGDIFDILNDGFDLMVAHPPCTYLANSGVRWLYEQEGRWELMQEGAKFFSELLHADIPKIAVENPTMHGFAKHIIQQEWTQSIQPYEFGHPQTKSTKLWLKNLPPLMPTNNVKHIMRKMATKDTDAIHYASPGADRWKLRSTTFQGIADAMADQWG